MKTAVVVQKTKAQQARKLLEAGDLWDHKRRLQKYGSDEVAIPVKSDNAAVLIEHLQPIKASVTVIDVDLPPTKAERLVSPSERLQRIARRLLEASGVADGQLERLLREVPSHWEKHGDLILLPATAFSSHDWMSLGDDLWQQVAKCIPAKRVARQATVAADGFRSPRAVLLLGGSGAVQQVDNGIRYEYDITKCMFSAGNITEKLRIAGFKCRGETVVDLFAGIGYFTLPYLVHAGAAHVHACEWNPAAVRALRRNLDLNNVAHRCTVHEGDNRLVGLTGVADRINLGLIPSSEGSWPVACRMLNPKGGVMHIHGNVNSQTAAGETLTRCRCLKGDGHTGGLVHVGRDSQCRHSDTGGGSAWKRVALEQGERGTALQTDTESRGQGHGDDDHHPASQPCGGDSAVTLVGDRPSGSGCLHCRTRACQDCREVDSLHSPGCDCLRQAHSTGSSKRCPNSGGCPSGCDRMSHADRLAPLPRGAAWRTWGEAVCLCLKALLEQEKGGRWKASVVHIEHVKSYAPHVCHIVLDVQCRPVRDLGD